MKLSFIGDVMLGRMIGSKYRLSPYPLIDDTLVKTVSDSDLVIANLESPVSINSKTEGDHLQFSGVPELLDEFKFVSLFSTANNHITDCGLLGIDETIGELEKRGFSHNGVYKEQYAPFLFEKGNEKVAVITFTDMLNIPFEDNSKWHVLRFGDSEVMAQIRKYKSLGYTIILFAHVGMLFTRFPNPITYDYLHNCVDAGADLIVTAHSHCLGGMEEYKGVPIFHSLGDFCMDGNSMRRRRAAMLNIDLKDGKVRHWEIVPTEVSAELKVWTPSDKVKSKMLASFNQVSSKISKHSTDYPKFYKNAYRKELLNHSISTLAFIFKDRGLSGLIKMIRMRATEVCRTIFWMLSDRSKVQRDDDAIKADRKKISQDELFGK